MKIIQCTIGPYPGPMPEGIFDQMPKVKVVFEDGSEKVLFFFYPDELSFSEDEFIGLSERQAMELKQKKDVDYLQR